MVREIKVLEGGSLLIGTLPKGCQLCAKGSKMVLFVTGLCDSSCYYCPLSQDKIGQDKTFADEMPVLDREDVIFEAKAIRAEGAGISGGDPLCSLKRTTDNIALLKSRFGSKFHTHLYTSRTDVSKETLDQLRGAGLDEIRFHPQGTDWSGIEQAISLEFVVGIEVPALPNNAEKLKKTALRAEELGVSFLNMNELEASETNFEQLAKMGMRLTDTGSASIKGSAETARGVLEWGRENLTTLNLHYCSARFKDSVQLRNRLERRLQETIRELEERDESDPLVIVGVLRGRTGTTLGSDQLLLLYQRLHKDLEVPTKFLNIDDLRNRVEIAPWILEQVHADIESLVEFREILEIGLAYEYPTYDRLQTLFEPL